MAKRIPEQAVVADIGSDHAYLPCYAVKKGLAKKAIAGEVADGPFRAAEQQVREAGLEAFIEVRKGNGLEVIDPQEADCITIAGMGGALIVSILQAGHLKLEGVKRLILQPNIGAEHIRQWLIDHHWELMEEEIIEEDGKIYEILMAEKGEPLRPYQKNREQAILLGPFLLKNKNEAFKKKWTREAAQLEAVLKNLEKAGDRGAAAKKKQQVLYTLQLIKEAISNEKSKWS